MNNIPNTNGANPLSFNPHGHKAPSQNESAEVKETKSEETQNKDPLKYVPGDQYGRAMVNQAQNQQRPQLNPQNIQDDVFTYQLMQEFAQELMSGYIQRGVDPNRAREMTAYTLDVLLNPPKQASGVK